MPFAFLSREPDSNRRSVINLLKSRSGLSPLLDFTSLSAFIFSFEEKETTVPKLNIRKAGISGLFSL